MTDQRLKIVAAQINVVVGDINNNTQLIIDAARHAIEEHHADIVVFPELVVSGYPPEDLLLRPGYIKRCHEAVDRICAENLPTCLILGYPALENGNRYNRVAVIQHGDITHTYDKQLLPNYTVFDEVRYFTPGDKPCVFEMNGINIGVIICEDTWFKAPSAQAKAYGAELIISPNASPYDRSKACARENMLRERTSEIHCPIIYTNLIGGQDELVFDGGSMVLNAKGERTHQGAYFKEDLMAIDIVKNNNKVDVVATELPPRLSAQESLYSALVLGVKDYINKNNFPGALIGLSGGIDSALTLAMTVDAIGAERVHGVLMPSEYTAQMSNDDAVEEATTLNVKHDIIPIKSLYDEFKSSLQTQFADTQRDVTEENLQARVRGTLLMALSNKFGSIVLTTGNKSELAVGYATLYGDMAGGFSVLKDIPKTLVYKLAEYRNSISPVIPERVITRAPSAELSPDQTDQDTLPPYPLLDEILRQYIELDYDPTDIYSDSLPKEMVDRVILMVNRNEYKRRQAAVGIRTTTRAFGKDRRYPITSGYSRNLC